jgi:hypothetical protein
MKEKGGGERDADTNHRATPSTALKEAKDDEREGGGRERCRYNPTQIQTIAPHHPPR